LAHDGVIDDVSRDARPRSGDEHEKLVVPGLPNVHSHAFQRAMAGLAERRGPHNADDFWSWRTAMYRFVASLEPDDLEAIAAYAYADMLEAGFTSVGEFHYLHRTPEGGLYADPSELALRHVAAADTTGIGLTLLPVFYEASNFGGVPPLAEQQRFATDLSTFGTIVERAQTGMKQGPRQNLGIAPHSLRAVTFASLAALLRQYPNVPIHIHAAEQLKEVIHCQGFCGLRPVEWLLRNADLGPRWCLVHATHVTEEEIKGVATSGAVVGLCPITEANLGDGVFPAVAYQLAGGRWAVGTDSNVCVDAAGELRSLEYSQRLVQRTRNALASTQRLSTGRSLYEAAAIGGAQALGRYIGAIASGHLADFLILDDTHPDLTGRAGDAVLDAWLFAVGRPLIRKVIAGGSVVVEDGRHRARERIDADYRRTMQRLLNGAFP
jgi:formimidoylglutamate deiminase